MTPTDTGVSEEIAKVLARCYLNGGDPGQPAARWNGSEIELQDFPVWKDHMTEARQVFEAIAPRLKAEGLREAAELARSCYHEELARFILARADALSPPVKETVRYDGQYPSEDPNWRKGRTESGGDI